MNKDSQKSEFLSEKHITAKEFPFPKTSNDMVPHFENGVLYYSFPRIDELGFVRHAFSTRIGGVSEEPFCSMNLGFNRGDSDENVKENYNIICRTIGVNPENLVLSSQTHDVKIMKVTRADHGKGFLKEKEYDNIDALITDEKDVVLSTHYADCVPLFFVDPVKKVIASAHSGWMGTLKRMGKETVLTMVRDYGCRAEDIIAGIAPSIGPCCFEVEEDVRLRFAEMPEAENEIKQPKDRPGKFLINLWAVNKNILTASGIKPENILSANICTKCHHEFFWSHRHHKAERGSLSALISMT